ncbi:LOW QUALITY PROTEIN: hypothetical protein PHMEG_00020781 [Phytophthora megakarya]|uniref:Uncharacterized protein n=1 Tax=Phytophthora megakarya TaxID=4795 RepID=A0A225VQT3_9STRA|nr:LOW QUALITY PROTEIN: hypothetical protein PHMEG_00020781 [Phytophthora megakarya]
MTDSIVSDACTADSRSTRISVVGDARLCVKRDHPVDHCLFVRRGCGELHNMGKCAMQEFYNQIRQWFNPNQTDGYAS